MRAIHFKRLALIAIWQTFTVAAVLYVDSSPRRWIPGLFAVAALLVPFIGYIAAVYDAPLIATWSRILKAGILTLSSIVVTVGGYCGLFFVGLLVKGGL